MFEDLLIPSRLPAALRQAISFVGLQAEQTLFYQGEPATSVYLVESGRVRVVSHALTGRTALLYRATVGQMLGETALVLREHTSEAIADVPSRVVGFPRRVIEAIVEGDERLGAAFTARLAERIRLLQERLVLNSTAPARDRVLEYLYYSVPKGGRTVALDRSFKEVAAELNLTQETLYRVLTVLEQEGTISRRKRSITLLQQSA